MKKLLNDKRLKYGTYSTAITIITIAILILINLVVGQFNRTFDLTKESIYSLSEETKEVLENIENDINIYTLFSTGYSDGVLNKVEQVISEYSQYSSKIKVSNVDLYLHPDFTKKYANENNSVEVNSIIVEMGDKYRVINYSDYYIQSDSSSLEKLSIESNLTSAVQFVNMETSPKIYFIIGHDETDFNHFTTLVDSLKISNYDMDSLNLIDNEIPSDCTALVITPGARDFTKEEAEKVKSYLADDGRAFFLIGGSDSNNFKNLMSIINAYGVSLANGYVLEGQQDKYYRYPYAVFPSIEEHKVNSVLLNKEYMTYAVASQAVTELEVKKQGLIIEPLLTTTDSSYIKAEGNSSPNKEANDIEGPFNIAAAVTDNSYSDKSHSTKIVVCGLSYYFIDPDYDSMVVNGNSTFVVSALNWLNDKSRGVSIAPKTISGDAVLIDESSANTVKIVGWALIPGSLFLAGFIIWLIRRNK